MFGVKDFPCAGSLWNVGSGVLGALQDLAGILCAVLCLATQSCPALCDPMTVARQAPLSLGFSRPEYWSGLPCLFQGIFPSQRSNPGLPHCRQTLYYLSHQGNPGWAKCKAKLMEAVRFCPLYLSCLSGTCPLPDSLLSPFRAVLAGSNVAPLS